MRAACLIVFLVLTIAGDMLADARPAHLFSDHMVLQRGMPLPVWGWDEPGEEVTVEFGGQSVSATAGPDGKWMVRLEALKADTKPRTMVIRGSSTATITDVLVGDVWLGSGQSNMEFAMRDVENASVLYEN